MHFEKYYLDLQRWYIIQGTELRVRKPGLLTQVDNLLVVGQAPSCRYCMEISVDKGERGISKETASDLRQKKKQARKLGKIYDKVHLRRQNRPARTKIIK